MKASGDVAYGRLIVNAGEFRDVLISWQPVSGRFGSKLFYDSLASTTEIITPIKLDDYE